MSSCIDARGSSMMFCGFWTTYGVSLFRLFDMREHSLNFSILARFMKREWSMVSCGWVFSLCVHHLERLWQLRCFSSSIVLCNCVTPILQLLLYYQDSELRKKVGANGSMLIAKECCNAISFLHSSIFTFHLSTFPNVSFKVFALTLKLNHIAI